jgi:hypothetical protein
MKNKPEKPQLTPSRRRRLCRQSLKEIKKLDVKLAGNLSDADAAKLRCSIAAEKAAVSLLMVKL